MRITELTLLGNLTDKKTDLKRLSLKASCALGRCRYGGQDFFFFLPGASTKGSRVGRGSLGGGVGTGLSSCWLGALQTGHLVGTMKSFSCKSINPTEAGHVYGWGFPLDSSAMVFLAFLFPEGKSSHCQPQWLGRHHCWSRRNTLANERLFQRNTVVSFWIEPDQMNWPTFDQATKRLLGNPIDSQTLNGC